MSFLKKRWIIIAAALLIIAASAGFSIYRSSVTRMLDKTAYSDLYNDIKDKAEQNYFTSQESLSDYITGWADTAGIDYKTDKNGNIIFTREASSRKKNLPPVVVCLSYNYETAEDNAKLLAGGAMIAMSDISSGSRTVIFFNDEKNNGIGYRKLNKKYLSGGSKIIYLDYGNSSYISCSSFAKNYSVIKVKAGRFEPECDSAVRVTITGLTSGNIGTGITKHPDPVSALSTLFTRLKSKSVAFQLADFEIGNNGSMYPYSAEATIMLN